MTPEVWNHTLIYGGFLSLALFLFIVGSSIYNRELWLNDYPPDIRQKYGRPSAQTIRQQKWFGVAMLVIMILVLLADGLTLPRMASGDPAFLLIFRSTFIVYLMGRLMDFLVIDLLLGAVIRPWFRVLPGTEGAAGYRNVNYHFNAFLRSVLSGAVLCLLLSAVVLVINTLV